MVWNADHQSKVIPSSYAGRGKTVDQAFVKIAGPCKPAQWVPQQYCFSQLLDMCVKGNSRGSNKRLYGKNKCQEWTISNW